MKLTNKLLLARVLRAGRCTCLKFAVLGLAFIACLGAQAASAAEVAPAKEPRVVNAQEARGQQAAPPAAVSISGPTSGPSSGPVSGQESAVSGSPVEVRELWTGSLYSSTYRVGVCFSGHGNVRGVVQLRLYNGKVDVYHIDGTVQNNDIEAHHSSGHKFKGRLVSADTVEGVISLKNGMNVRLEGKRVHDVELAPEDCAPMPQ